MSINSNVFDWISGMLGSQSMLLQAAGLLIYALLVVIMMSVFAYLFGWVERKIIAKAQYRHGPTYVGKFGILQNLADLVKLLAKEMVTPKNADLATFLLAPLLLVSITVFVILLLPFSPTLQASEFGLGLLAVFVLLGFTPILVFISGFASGNKFADVSAQRSVLMLLSYEIPTLMVVAAIALASGGYNISSVVSSQSHLVFAISMPIGLIVFFITMLAELERTPFDIKEADSELIAGWLTDISAPYYSIALLLDYSRMFMGSLIIALLFFGGWLGPVLPPVVWLVAKATLISLAIIFVRVTTVRMRIDSVLRLGWRWLIPLSLINLVIAYALFG